MRKRPLVTTQHSALLAARAHGLRASPTPTEAALWSRLKSKQLGVEFRRQVVLDRYIADFVAPGRKLIVEVDGAYHRERASADARRDRKLRRLGFRILRVDAELVRLAPERAVAQIRAALDA